MIAVSRRLLSNARGLALSKRLELLYTYDKNHVISDYVAKTVELGNDRHASDVLIFVRYPGIGLIARSSAVGRSVVDHTLSMIFAATIGTTVLSVLFDSGSTNCFMRRGLTA